MIHQFTLKFLFNPKKTDTHLNYFFSIRNKQTSILKEQILLSAESFPMPACSHCCVHFKSCCALILLHLLGKHVCGKAVFTSFPTAVSRAHQSIAISTSYLQVLWCEEKKQSMIVFHSEYVCSTQILASSTLNRVPFPDTGLLHHAIGGMLSKDFPATCHLTLVLETQWFSGLSQMLINALH